MVCFRYIIVDTLHKGDSKDDDDDDDDNNNNNNNKCHYNGSTDNVVYTGGFLIRFPADQQIYLFCNASRPSLPPARPLIRCVPKGKESGRNVKLTTLLT